MVTQSGRLSAVHEDIVATATVEAGRLTVNKPDRFHQLVHQLPDGEYHLKVTPLKASRSLRQNNYYWGVVLKYIAEKTGHSRHEIHESMKELFLLRPIIFKNDVGQLIELHIVNSTTSLDIPEFFDYTERVKQWASDFLKIAIPSAPKG